MHGYELEEGDTLNLPMRKPDMYANFIRGDLFIDTVKWIADNMKIVFTGGELLEYLC